MELKEDEKQLLEWYRQMNASGKSRVFDTAEFCVLRHPVHVIPLSVLEKAREKKICKENCQEKTKKHQPRCSKTPKPVLQVRDQGLEPWTP